MRALENSAASSSFPNLSEIVRRLVAAAEAEEKLIQDLVEAVESGATREQVFRIAQQLTKTQRVKTHTNTK